jgi:hypothetical protein
MDNSNGAPGADQTPAESARRIKDSASTLLDRGKDAASTIIERGKDAAAQRVEQGRLNVTESAQSATSALRRAAGDVEGENALIGSVLRKSADTIEKATNAIASGDLSSGLSDLNAFARRQPAIFLGVSALLGFALARVGKTAIEAANQDDSNETYNPYTSPTPGL